VKEESVRERAKARRVKRDTKRWEGRQGDRLRGKRGKERGTRDWE